MMVLCLICVVVLSLWVLKRWFVVLCIRILGWSRFCCVSFCRRVCRWWWDGRVLLCNESLNLVGFCLCWVILKCLVKVLIWFFCLWWFLRRWFEWLKRLVLVIFLFWCRCFVGKFGWWVLWLLDVCSWFVCLLWCVLVIFSWFCLLRWLVFLISWVVVVCVLILLWEWVRRRCGLMVFILVSRSVMCLWMRLLSCWSVFGWSLSLLFLMVRWCSVKVFVVYCVFCKICICCFILVVVLSRWLRFLLSICMCIFFGVIGLSVLLNRL